MERGASNGFQRLPKSNSGTKMNQSTVDMSAAEQDGACNVREQDRFMPIANVIRIMRRILPTHAKISDDAKETIQECVSEYISFITSEANDRCQREQRKTITAEDVLWAMGKLGFDEYIQPLTLYLQRYREFEGERGATMRGGGAGGDPLLKRSMSELSPLAAAAYNPAAAFHMAHHRGFFAAAGAAQPMNGYFRDGSNVSASGQSAMASFDPYAAFK